VLFNLKCCEDSTKTVDCVYVLHYPTTLWTWRWALFFQLLFPVTCEWYLKCIAGAQNTFPFHSTETKIRRCTAAVEPHHGGRICPPLARKLSGCGRRKLCMVASLSHRFSVRLCIRFRLTCTHSSNVTTLAGIFKEVRLESPTLSDEEDRACCTSSVRSLILSLELIESPIVMFRASLIGWRSNGTKRLWPRKMTMLPTMQWKRSTTHHASWLVKPLGKIHLETGARRQLQRSATNYQYS